MQCPSPLFAFVALFALLYGAFGAASPFLPSLVEAHGIPPEQIGILFAAGTAIRLISAPLAGRIADRTSALRATFAVCAVATSAAALSYLQAWGFWPILAVSLCHSLALAPTTNLADALALLASRASRAFEYGWVRGAGSLAFVLASLLAGHAISAYGLWIIVVLQALLMLAVAVATLFVSSVDKPAGHAVTVDTFAAVKELFGEPVFLRVVLVAALILGSHAMHDTFAMIRWRRAGIPPEAAAVLWSLSVGGEVVVFVLAGPWLVRMLTPAGAIALAAITAAGRWLVAAFTADFAMLAVIQPLHGITFALLHLACMRLLAVAVPAHLAATAQAVYGTVGVGAATALLTLLSGWLYAGMGARAFIVMSLLCLLALPIAPGLRGR